MAEIDKILGLYWQLTVMGIVVDIQNKDMLWPCVLFDHTGNKLEEVSSIVLDGLSHKSGKD